MNRLLLLIVSLMVFASFDTRAQERTAAEIAEREAMEERIRRLNADVESLTAANTALQRRLTEFARELRELREAQARAASNTTVQNDIKRLAEKVEEVDRKREADKKLIIQEIAALGKALSGASRPPATTSPRPPAPAIPTEGYEHLVESGDTLSKIVERYNLAFREQGMKTVTLKQVQDANPGLVPERMRIGDKVFIPKPGN